MGIDISSKLMVGVSFNEIEEHLVSLINKDPEIDNLYDAVEKYFEYASPWFDSAIDYWFIGWEIPNYKSPDQGLYDLISSYTDEFELTTGIVPRLAGLAHVY